MLYLQPEQLRGRDLYRRVIKSFLFQLKMLKMNYMVICLLEVFYEYYALVYR